MLTPRVVVLSAMYKEVEKLLSQVKICSKKVYLNYPVWEVTLHEQQLVLALTGIGKVNAALVTQHLIKSFQISHIYNLGVAGGISPKVKIGDVVVASKVAQSDFNLTVFGHFKGQVPGFENRYLSSSTKENTVKILSNQQGRRYKVHYGVIVTADQFVENRKMMVKLGEEFGALCKDMESAAIGQVCFFNKTSFTVVRGICDNSGKNAMLEYQNNLERSIDSASEVLLELLQNN